MAVNVVIPLLIPLEENLHNTTRLLSGAGGGGGPLQFSEPRYCLLLAEDAPPALRIAQVSASHKDGVGVRYSIRAGNRDGLFTIDQHSGLITLAAPLDYELHAKHELVVAAEAAGHTAHAIVQVTVVDVNDNQPHFLEKDLQVTVVEEEDARHLPHAIVKVVAEDPDAVDQEGLVYSVGGEGVDGHSPSDAYFTINPHTGDLLLLRALDRDPPLGRGTWKVKVQVRDGQWVSSPSMAAVSRHPRVSKVQYDLPQDTGTLSRPARVPQGQYDPSLDTGASRQPRVTTQGQTDLSQDSGAIQGLNSVSKDPIVPPKDRSVVSSAPGDYPDTRYSSQEPKLPERDQYLLLQDPRRPKNRYSLTQDPFEPHDVEVQVEDEEETEEQDEDNLETDGRQERSGQKDEREDVPISGNKQMYVMYERDETNVKETNKLSGRNEMENLTSKAPKEKEEFIQKRRRAAGKKRKLRDNNHRHTKEDTSGDTKHKGPQRGSEPNDARRVLELPNISPHPGYGFQIGSHKSLHKFLPANWNNDESLEFPRDRGDQHFEDSVHAEDKPEKQRLLRPRYIMHRKHQQFGVRRKLLSVRGLLKLEALQSYLEDETSDVNQKVSGILEPERCHKDNATLSLVEEHPYSLRESPGTRSFNRRTHPIESAPMEGSHEVSDDKYCENLSAPSTASTASASTRGERDSTSDASGNVKPEEGGREARAAGGTISKREVDDPLPQRGLPLDQEPLKQFSEDRRYVRGFTADGGGCQDHDAFSITSEEQSQREMAHMLDMRRERVHVAETVVTVLVKDVNDNAPVFPNVTIYGEVQENGPIDLSAGVVWAWDADDQQEGTNAHLTYSIEKNVVDERSGQAIFAVNPETGLVRTAVCCLDRETTPEYHIQVVATDGGGLKGTGTVVVRLADVNDNSPRLTRDLWQVEVDETWGHGAPSNATLLQVSTADHDTSNYFFYRVVEGSGWGWQHFGMRTEGTAGQLFARQTLDFEDAAHRRGFRFMIQVTDRGRGGWSDARHTDTAWVEVRLRDLNDNPPQFRRPHAHVTVREDAAPGTLLASLPATDPDMMMQQGVEYHVEGGWGALSVDGSGGVRLWRALDREAPGGEVGVARVVAVDEGRPSLSSTATLTITVTDVNDCPPRLLPPTLLHVTEGAPASLLGLLTATDDDVWALAHGPPFNFTLAPSNPAHVLDSISIKYDSSIDSGRGGAEVWTLRPVDREEHRQLTAEVVVADAGGLAATQPVTVIIDDVNDNPMKPAAKTVYLWKTRGGGADAALGRVYVEDPDDWDLQDKTFSWAGPPHPLFTLQSSTGEIFASTQLMEGRYELHFSVSDRVWGQKDVAAKVTVGVKYLSPEAVAHAVPLTLTPTTPATLATGWTPKLGGGGLGTLIEAVMQVLGREAEAVEIISVHGLPDLSTPPVPISHRPSSSSSSDTSLVVPVMPAPPHLACVWLSVKQIGGSFMDPIKLHGLLALHLQYLEKVMNLRVGVEDTHTVQGKNEEATSSYSASSPSDTTSLASVALPLQVVDTNLTSLVTPRLTRASDCHILTHYRDNACTPTSCLNGGRCIRTDIGNRCVCPGWSWGPHCKVLARTFTGSSWAWVRPLPPCLPTTLSLRLLTLHTHALIIYSGPLSSSTSHPHYPPMPMMALQLVDGQPQVLLEGMRGPIKLQVAVKVNTGTWHTIHMQLSAQGVTLMVDLCGHGWGANTTNDAHCIARAPWVDAQVTESWGSSAPLQLGGLAHPYPQSADYGWSNTIVNQALDGCISHLTVNGELIDLGEPAYSSGSVKSCRPQETACRDKLGSCGLRGHCVDGLNDPRCDCLPGWAGPECAVPTIPVALSQASYMKVALSFKPNPYDLSLQLRVRTLGHPSGLLVRLAASQQSHALKLHLRGGVACALVSGMEWTAQEACLEGFPLGDGLWHSLQVSRHGHNLIISVDDGDGWRRNETLTSLLTTTSLGDLHAVVTTPPMPIYVDNQYGTTVGGIPEFEGLSPITVHDDLHNSCIDDVRVSGHPLPLPPSVNGTSWGQVTSQQNLEQGCPTPDFCTNTTCFPPLSCHNSWRHATCSCEPGQQLMGLSCQDIDECVYQPCLHGGTCHNLKPGYLCTCGPAHIGDNCEWAKISMDLHPLTAPIAIAALTLFILVIVVIGVLLNIRFQRSRAARSMAEHPGDVEGVTGTLGTSVESQVVIESHPAAKEENIILESLMIRVPKKQVPQTPEGRKHLVTSLGVSTLESETKAIRDISLHMPGTTMIVPAREIDKNQESANPQRCSIASLTTASMADAVTEHRKSTSPTTTECPSRTRDASANIGLSCAQPLLAQDDLRAYAYEGDGSPSGSLTSTVVGLRTESLEDESLNPLVPEYREVFDLLKNLPDANNHSSNYEGCESPTSKLQTGVNIT